MGGLAGVLVRLFRSIGGAFLTVMFGSEVAEKSDTRKVVIGSLILCSTVAGVTSLIAGSRHAVELIVAVLFGGGLFGAFLGLGSLWLTDSSFE